ncbi:MAG: stage II sporulation protein M [Bacillota bacterium]|nr:stage II sporulation protein M [Bacillota bacterium]
MKLFFPPGQVIKNNRSWFLMAAAVFIICLFIFAGSTAFSEPVDEEIPDLVLDDILSIFADILETNPLLGAALIFMNNMITMAQMLLLGAAAGISPLITLGINGALLGSTLSMAVMEGANLFYMLGLGILPHGIFELPAVFICAGLGLKFGYHCIASPLSGKTRSESYRFIWKEAISILPLVVTMLIAAALVEMFITPRLLEFVL